MGFQRPKRRSYSEDELYEYAVGALARRMRTVAELKRLMRARIEEAESEYGQTLVELVVRRLKDQGYLNDAQYAASYSSLRRDNQKLGRMRVVTELKTRGVHGSVIEKAVGAAYEGVSDEKADGAHLPAARAGRIRNEDHLHDPEKLGCGRRDAQRPGRRKRLARDRAPAAEHSTTEDTEFHRDYRSSSVFSVFSVFSVVLFFI
jgi:SOS response regulatory protein OraA/RecX